MVTNLFAVDLQRLQAFRSQGLLGPYCFLTCASPAPNAHLTPQRASHCQRRRSHVLTFTMQRRMAQQSAISFKPQS